MSTYYNDVLFYFPWIDYKLLNGYNTMIDIYKKKGWDKNNHIQKLTFVYFKIQFKVSGNVL